MTDKNENKITITDIDGNVYNTITIGRQVWMAENLMATRFRNGDSLYKIPGINKSNKHQAVYDPAYAEYSELGYVSKYYNWYSVADVRNIAPLGWHVPTAEEWTMLIIFLGGEGAAGPKLKGQFKYPRRDWNKKATNESGFNGLPFGYRKNSNGEFYEYGEDGSWWSSTKGQHTPIRLSLFGTLGGASLIENNIHIGDGVSIRCVKDYVDWRNYKPNFG